ncbi:heme biosynthesis HemY N-terminal domain-containing protein [Pseudomonas sp. LS44]|uniref:heme biosynthesis HemY N-terminal domain-containing protein n=1 Tax=Pseudomonas sp. LS44 TaxID=1357074 RepID=UPI0035C7640C
MTRVRIVLIVLLVIAAAVLIGMAAAENAGYVLIAYKGFRYESSLWAFLALLAFVWLVLFGLRLLFNLMFVSGGVVNPWSQRNRRRRSQQAAEQGMLDLVEGRWARALRHLKRAAEGQAQPLIYYLGAARAAQKLDQPEESDAMLERALERQPQAELAIALAHAELLQGRGQLDTALETLSVMRERYPNHPQVLRQLQQIQQQRGDWSALQALMPELRKHKVLEDRELTALERQVWSIRLAEAGNAGLNAGETALQPLTQAWQQLPSAQRHDVQLVATYAEQLRQLGAQPEAEELLRKTLKQQYDAQLVALYGLVRGSDPMRQLQTAEGWLPAHSEDATLLLALGRLSLQNQLWGKAQEYFESSLRFDHNPQTCAELARLLARLGERERSNQLLQESLALFGQRLPNLPLPEPVRV